MNPLAPQQLLAALDPQQREVATSLHGAVRVLAGAGTGKTRAITHRIAYGIATGAYQPEHILAVTFTTRAAGEMRERLRSLGAPGVQARTFHSAALRQLRYFWPKVYGGAPPELMKSKLRMLTAVAHQLRLGADQLLVRDLAAEIEWAKVSNVLPHRYAELAQTYGREVPNLTLEQVEQVYSSYEEHKRQAGLIDMEDVLLVCAGILQESPPAAAQVRSQYQWYVVDEYQDVSPLQAALLNLWLGERDQVCVVGDPAQTIYSFAGAQATYLQQFCTQYPNATSIELVTNYRSTPQIIETANKLIVGHTPGAVTLRSHHPAGPAVGWHECPDEVAEAEQIAARLRQLASQGVAFADMAVLFRINAQADLIAEALAAANIPFLLRGVDQFYDRPEVRQALSLLRGSVRAGESSEADLGGQVSQLLATMGYSSQRLPDARSQQRWESLAAIVHEAELFAAAHPQATLAEFMDEMARRAHEQSGLQADGVTLTTMHAAKGLEWDVVCLAGIQEGRMPLTYATSVEEIAEERRLLYVGVTRARRQLEVFWSLARTEQSNATRSVSRFLVPLLQNPTPAPPRRRPSQTRSRRKAAVCRSCGGPLTTNAQRNRGVCNSCPTSYDEQLFEALRTWRLERSKQKQMPAFLVFSNATLEAICEAEPQNLAELRSIRGVGNKKLALYGDEILEIIAKYRAA